MDDYDNKAIGERLQIARKAAGYETATAAASALEVPYPTYASHENGNRGVVRGALTYSRRFRISLDWLLAGRGIGPGGKPATSEAALRDAVSAYGVKGNDLDVIMGLAGRLSGKSTVETPEQTQPDNQSQSASRPHTPAPTGKRVPQSSS